MKHFLQSTKSFAALLLLILCCNFQAYAQWSNNPAVNNAISTSIAGQTSLQIISDGHCGAIMVWQAYVSGSDNIYAQRIDASGVVQWTANGIAVCTSTGNQQFPELVSDGAGGAIITWKDLRNGNMDIYAQRINSSGVVQWTANGVAICTSAGDQDYPQIISDASGGAIISWPDLRTGNSDIYTQRISASGAVQWTANGVVICTAANDQDFPRMISDGSGGAIINWQDLRNGNSDIYAQRIDALGTIQWTANGIAICTLPSYQIYPEMTSDGSGGAIMTWQDFRSGNADIYAQRIDALGAIQWTANGVAVCIAINYQTYISIIGDGLGGVIICWQDTRNANQDIYAQKMNASGIAQWTANGVAICSQASDQYTPQLVSDGLGNTIITWYDFRNGFSDIYAQRLNTSGVIQWTANGIAISSAPDAQNSPVIISDNYGGGIIAWTDNRTVNPGIYAQQVNSAGSLGVAQTPEINVKGNNVNIVDGDITPAAGDHTNFVNVVINTSPTRTYTIQNTGSGNLAIPSITSSNALFTIGALTPASPIAPGDSATFVVTFSPTTTGVKNGTITINNNDCDESVYTYAIRGTGATSCPTLTFNETHVEACYGTTDGSITISGSAGGAGPYSFSKDSGLTYQSGNTFSNLAPGIYQMRNKDMNGCESAALAVNVNDLTPPTIICPPVTTMFMDVYTNCGSNLPLPIMTDNCPFTYLLPATIAYRVNNGGTKTTTTNTGAMGDSLILAVDTNRIYWSITDFSGNTDSCVQTIILYDTIAPLYKPVFDNYAFETATGVMLEDLSTGATEIIPSGSDNVSSAVQQIPFYFDFHSVAYSDFSVSSNGLIGFGTTAVTTSAINSTSGGQHNRIYALWDNLHTGTNGSVKFKVVGTRPYRKLVIEFNVRNASETGNYTKTFQVWLFETSHKVQLVYGAGTNMPAATIGVRGANATVYNDVTSSNHTGSKRIINDANTAWPGSGRSYIFTPAIFATASAGTCSANVVVQAPDFWECSQDFIAYSNYGTTYGTGFYANSYILLYNFPVGTTPLIYTVSDKYDSTIVNTATYSIPVIVEDTTLPVINCSGAQSFNTSPGLCTGAATVTPPTITDDCSSFAINNALNFDGMNDIVKVASTSVISTASQNKRTIEVSFKVNDKNISSQKQVIWEEGGSSNGLNMYVYNGSLYYGIYSVSNGWTGTWLSTPNIVNGQWHKAVLVYDSAKVTGRLIAYLDGTIVGSADSSATLGNALAIHNTGTNGIGALASNGRFHDGAVTLAEGHYFGGDIDELRIWNVARTPQELVSTGLSPLTGTETGLVLYYNFNQGAACGNNTGVNSLDDITATNVNGVVTNMTLNGSCVSNWTTGAPAYSNPITLTNSFNNTSDASGNYPIGTTNVIWTASDASGNEVTCTQAITVNDNQAPTLLAPANQNLNVIANTCAANYTIADPFTDNCTGGTWGYSTTGATILTSSGNTRNDGQSSGVLSFNKGTTIVTLTGTDGSNAATSTTFTVTVTDNQAPTLVAPANQNLNVIANTCAANYTIADPFTDNCTGGTWGYSTTGATILTSSGNTRNDGQSSGVLSFNKGTTIVTLTGTDGSNAATSTTFTVTVTDNQAPTLLAPANQNLNVIANTCAANYTIADPFTDNCTGGTWGYSTTGATILTSSGNTRNDGQSSGVLSFNKGTTIVTLTGTDGINIATSTTFTVTVTDNQAPTLLAPANQNLNVIANTCAANYTIADPFTDNCTGGTWGYSTTGATILTSSGNTRNDGQSSGVLSFNKGTTIVTLTGTDGSNAATSTTFTVTVTDNQAPTLVAPANQNLNVIANTCAANYTIADPFTDNCTGGTWGYSTTGATILTSSGNTRNDGQSSGVLSFNKGTTIVTLTGTDGSNAATSTTFTVTVTDNQAPTLLAPANQNLNVIANTCAANYTIADPFTDNCTGGTWGYSTTGATILTSSGNTRNDGQSSGVLSFNKGTTIVTLTGTDGINIATSTTFTVTVTDNQAPTLLAPANQNLNVIANTCAANYTIADPFTDNCTGGTWGYSTTGATILTSSGNTRNDGQSSGVLSFNKGTTIVTLTGTDGTNIATSTTFTVTVNDHQIPTLSPFISQTINTVNCSAGNFTIPDPITDNCPGATWGYSIKGATVDSVGGIPDGTNSSVLSLNPGYNEFNLYGVDASGNTSLVHTRQILVSSPTCTQMVNLKALLQGFYIGDTTMATVLLNQGVSASNLIADSISIQLSIAPPTMNGSTYYTLLNTDGSASFNIFPTPYKDYYIRIRHRNSIETWTSTPVFIGATTNYDFTNAASKAYGGNQIEVEPGIFAIYTGDINQDGVIDGLDYNDWENDSNNFSGGYFSTDLNGDGVVDGLDFIYWEQNSNNFVGAIMP